MFENFESLLEEKKKIKDYPKIIREIAILTEEVIFYIFNNIHTKLDNYEDFIIFLNYEEKIINKDKLNYLKFLEKPMLGYAISYYKLLINEFIEKIEKNKEEYSKKWIVKNVIIEKISIINELRKEKGEVHGTKLKQATKEDAFKAIEALKNILEIFNLNGIEKDVEFRILKECLIYDSIEKTNKIFESKRNKLLLENIAENSKKIIVELLNELIKKNYSKIDIEDKKKLMGLLEKDEDYLILNENSKKLTYKKYIKILKETSIIKSKEILEDLERVEKLELSNEKYDEWNIIPYKTLPENIINYIFT